MIAMSTTMAPHPLNDLTRPRRDESSRWARHARRETISSTNLHRAHDRRRRGAETISAQGSMEDACPRRSTSLVRPDSADSRLYSNSRPGRGWKILNLSSASAGPNAALVTWEGGVREREVEDRWNAKNGIRRV